jgi:WD40 repeat protein
LAADQGRALTAELSGDGEWLASGGQDGKIKVWETSLHSASQVADLDEQPWAAEFSPCGRWLAIVSGPLGRPGRVTMYEVSSGRRLWAVEPSEGGSRSGAEIQLTALPACQIAFDDKGDEMISLDGDFVIRGRHCRSGEIVKVYRQRLADLVFDVQCAPDGRSLILRSGHEVFTLARQSCEIQERFPNSGLLRLGICRTVIGDVWIEHDGMRRTVNLHKVQSDTPLVALDGPGEKIHSFAVSSDGRLLAAAGADRIVYVWDVAKSRVPSKCIGHEGTVDHLCFAPDGKTLLSRGGDGTVRFWHLATRTELVKIGSDEQWVTCMGLNPAANLFVLGVKQQGRFRLEFHPLGSAGAAFPKCFATETASR